MQTLELLSPAKNFECGKAAIDHGADAVYIGAPRFGARAAVGNSIDDIAQLCRYAHLFGAKVYVTVNTIIYNDELTSVGRLLEQLSDIHVDAVLVQDMALTLEPSRLLALGKYLPIHASTQTDNRTIEKVKWLRSLGFKRVVLARELSINEIAEIHHEVPDVELEVFVHGALCVSYSGLCYASHYCFGRSANRGECAQICRMKFDLIDSNNQTIVHDRYLLSLKDMCQFDNLEALAEAGAVSFKIEGRLKDIDYVKNVTAAYSQRLNQIVEAHPSQFCRASQGKCRYSFTPNLYKTFNRGYTTYFAKGRQSDIATFTTPKSLGEYVGYVKEIQGRSFTVAGTTVFANGDGLCYLDDHEQLVGFRVNKAENNRIYPQQIPSSLHEGCRLYRNSDQVFQQLLSKPSSERRIPITMELKACNEGFILSSQGVTVSIASEHQKAEKPQRDNIIRQLTKLGGTPYECSEVILPADFNYFIPSSQLSALRHDLVDAMITHQLATHEAGIAQTATICQKTTANTVPVPAYALPYYYNISNNSSHQFYAERQLKHLSPAFELEAQHSSVLMQCRHCLRFALGYCVRNGGKQPTWKEPLFLQLANGKRFRLQFDCRQCQMNVWNEE